MLPKSTAEIVLVGVWLTECDRGPEHPLPHGLGDYSRSMLEQIGSPLVGFFRYRIVRWFSHLKEAKTLPGVCAHYAARKGFIEDQVLRLDRPVLVVLGAGYDGLAYRQASRRKVVELDREELQARKRQLLSGLPPKLMSFVAASLPAGHAMPTFDEPTTYVTEGVFMYLSESEVEQVLSDIPRGSALIFTFVGLDSQGRPAMGPRQEKVDRLLDDLQEPFRWGIDPSTIGDFLNRNGYALDHVDGFGFPNSDGMIEGEWIAHCIKR